MNINDVMGFWITTFTTELQTSVSDALKLNLIKRAPFQEDPVSKAPYLLITENNDEGKGCIPQDPEIGGGFPWKIHLRIKASPKVQRTADEAYRLVDLLGQRIVYVIRKYAVNDVVYGDIRIQNRDWHIIENVSHKVYGGEGEMLSYVSIDFFNRVHEVGPFPFGVKP